MNVLSNIVRFARLCFIFGVLWIVDSAALTAAEWGLEVHVDKVVYRSGQAGVATVIIKQGDRPRGKLRLKSHLEHGLSQRIEPANSTTELAADFSDEKPITLTFAAPHRHWGCAFVVQLFDGDTLLAEGRDIFAVGTDHFRLGQQSNHGGQLLKSTVGSFKPDGFWPKKWLAMKGTWNEIFAGLPSEVCGLVPEHDEWVTMQSKYRMSTAGIRAYIEAAHRLGMKIMMYNNATPSGWVGTAWARQHPEWLSYDGRGAMRGNLRVRDIERQKRWHVTLKAEPEISAFEPIYLNFANPNLVEFGCDEMLGACREFGYDGVRFDGHWIIGDVASAIGFDIDGRRPNRGDSADAVSRGILRQMKDYCRQRKSDFAVGFNYGDNYERGGARNPEAYRTACADGGMILWEGAAFGDLLSNWRIGARKLRNNALRVHQNGGIHYGQAHMNHIQHYPCNDFSLRYYYITNFACTSHIYSGLYPGHPNYRDIQDLYYRFALGYGELLYDEQLQPLRKPADYLSVTASGKETSDLWWKPYTYKRQLTDRYQIISHLVNMPASDVTKQTSTPDKQPAPLNDVRLNFKSPPQRVFILDPEAKDWIRQYNSTASLTIPQLKSWKIIVQEFSGSCKDLPVEVIPQVSLRGKDRIPDPIGGRVVLPVTLFATGDLCTSFAADDSALLGIATKCAPQGLVQPKHLVMSGPSLSRPDIAPGRIRTVFRIKVADNSTSDTVLSLQGGFGNNTIKRNDFKQPGVYQEFAYEHDLKEGASNFLRVEFHGGVQTWIDAIVLQQVSKANDHGLFAAKSLAVSELPARKTSTKRIHVLRGLWHDFFKLDAAAKRAGLDVDSSWEILSNDRARLPVDFPVTVDELMAHDVIALLNVSADSVKAVRRKNLREYVLRGGTLFVGGGPRAFGHGGYDNTLLEDLLPVHISAFDLREAKAGTQRIYGTEKFAFDSTARVAWYHHCKPKTGADVLLRTDAGPILTRWKAGHGTVYAFTATPCGQLPQGTAWWESKAWNATLDQIFTTASSLPKGDKESAVPLPLLAKLERGNFINATRKTVKPDILEGVIPTSNGLSFGFDQPDAPKGRLVLPAGLIKPTGSIKFTITPGWETDFSDLNRSVTLYSTASKTHGGTFQIYIYVHSADNYAMAVHVRTNEVGTESPVGHGALYAIKSAPVGSGNSSLKTSIWKKGQPKTVEVRWSPSQLILYEDGQRMATSDYAPEMDISSFTGKLHIGGNESGRLSRVLMQDIEIHGRAD
ncbi:MAG: hypothetical protein CMJ78_11705 [Planctomycetaceae bacterium]|nr:hypothetical protein [Planctomycetaceae bacterium]